VTGEAFGPDQDGASLHGSISRRTFEQLVHIRSEGDDWDFKATLGDLSVNAARVNLAKDALAFCNLPAGGTFVVGVTDTFERVGLGRAEKIDTTAIRRAIEKYIDGDFTVMAAEHIITEDGEAEAKRFGIIHVRRRFAQPVLAAQLGQVDKSVLFRPGDILIRRGAASIRANSMDVRLLLASSVVQEEKVRAVNELWRCLVEGRRLLPGIETLYDMLWDSEYGLDAFKAYIRASLTDLTEIQHASRVDELQLRVSLIRPHIPDALYRQYRSCAALVGRVQWKAIRKRETGRFASWTDLESGSPDQMLRQMASELIEQNELDTLWAGQVADDGTRRRPVRPLFDASERGVLATIDQVLRGMA
jgi:Putative DNA-binding domain